MISLLIFAANVLFATFWTGYVVAGIALNRRHRERLQQTDLEVRQLAAYLADSNAKLGQLQQILARYAPQPPPNTPSSGSTSAPPHGLH